MFHQKGERPKLFGLLIKIVNIDQNILVFCQKQANIFLESILFYKHFGQMYLVY